MQDTDMAGPLVFCLAFGGSLLLVSIEDVFPAANNIFAVNVLYSRQFKSRL